MWISILASGRNLIARLAASSLVLEVDRISTPPSTWLMVSVTRSSAEFGVANRQISLSGAFRADEQFQLSKLITNSVNFPDRV